MEIHSNKTTQPSFTLTINPNLGLGEEQGRKPPTNPITGQVIAFHLLYKFYPARQRLLSGLWLQPDHNAINLICTCSLSALKSVSYANVWAGLRNESLGQRPLVSFWFLNVIYCSAQWMLIRFSVEYTWQGVLFTERARVRYLNSAHVGGDNNTNTHAHAHLCIFPYNFLGNSVTVAHLMES